MIRRVTQRLPQPVHRFIQAVVEVHKRVGRPELLLELLAADEPTGMLQQNREYLKGLVLQDEPVTVALEFPALQVELKLAETDLVRRLAIQGHGSTPIGPEAYHGVSVHGHQDSL